MTNQQRLVVALVFVVAVVGGGALALLLTGGGDGTGASPSPIAQGSPSAAASPSASTEPSASVEPSPSEAPSPNESPSAAPTEAPTEAPTPTPRPTTAPGIPTTVIVTGFQLDAAADSSGSDRRLVFRSQGAGTISVNVRLLSPQGDVEACLYAAGDQVECPNLGLATVETEKRREDWEVELRGVGIETPEVEVTITFPARNPFLEIHDARFDGTSFPQTNGINVLVNPREDGEVTLEAEWGGHPFSYEVDLFQLDGPGTQVLANQGPDVGTDVAIRVVAGQWRLLLQNIDDGFGTTPLDAVITWP